MRLSWRRTLISTGKMSEAALAVGSTTPQLAQVLAAVQIHSLAGLALGSAVSASEVHCREQSDHQTQSDRYPPSARVDQRKRKRGSGRAGTKRRQKRYRSYGPVTVRLLDINFMALHSILYQLLLACSDHIMFSTDKPIP